MSQHMEIKRPAICLPLILVFTLAIVAQILPVPPVHAEDGAATVGTAGGGATDDPLSQFAPETRVAHTEAELLSILIAGKKARLAELAQEISKYRGWEEKDDYWAGRADKLLEEAAKLVKEIEHLQVRYKALKEKEKHNKHK